MNRTGSTRASRLAPLLLVFLAGCASGATHAFTTETDRLDAARAQIADRDHREAILLLESFLRDNPGSRYLDEATFLLGQEYYEEGQYLEAESRFRTILKDFPESAFAVEASYRLGLSLLSQSRSPELDQTETLAAQQEFESFVRRYPEHALAPRAREHLTAIHEKLAEKDLRNARTYQKRHQWDSAIYYLEKKVVEAYPDTRAALEATYRLFDIYRKRYEKDHDEADLNHAASWGQKALSRDPEGERANDIRRFFAETGVPMSADSTGSR